MTDQTINRILRKHVCSKNKHFEIETWNFYKEVRAAIDEIIKQHKKELKQKPTIEKFESYKPIIVKANFKKTKQ